MDEYSFDSDELPAGIGKAHSREILSVQAHSAAIHTWWARRSGAFSRVATYLALTQKRDVDSSFLETLATYPLPASTLADAARHVRDTQWRQAWNDATRLQSTSLPDQPGAPELPPPRVLDPFAGAAGIPLEAARLGCSAHALDLSPVAVHIARATTVFPGKFGRTDDESVGTNEAGHWAGLSNELGHWTKVVTTIAEARVKSLFPDSASHTFIWFHAASCPSCGASVPFQANYPLTRGVAPIGIVFTVEGSTLQPTIGAQSSELARRRQRPICLSCGFDGNINEGKSSAVCTPILAAVSKEDGFHAVVPSEVSTYFRWTPHHEGRLRHIQDADWSTLNLALPLSYSQVGSFGCHTFADLFTARQRLVALEYAVAVREASVQMNGLGMSVERVQALTTYLTFLVDFIVERNSRISRWNPNTMRPESALVKLRVSLPPVFVETHPRRLVSQWLDRILPAITELGSVPPTESVLCGNAMKLPYPDSFFDAVVTDPPYFDRVPYTDLSDFFWVWERPLLSLAVPELGFQYPTTMEVVESPAVVPRDDEREQYYWHGYEAVTVEVYRVLKPGSLFTLVVTSPTASVFDSYISLSQNAGFELFSVRYVEEGVRNLTADRALHRTYLICFRKPQIKNRVMKPEVVNAAQILEAAEANQPLFYEGLAQLLLDELEESEVQGLLTEEYKGTTFERFLEVLADRDLRDLLRGLFGEVGLRKLVRKLGIAQGEASKAPEDLLLSHFGFATPTPQTLKGAHQAITQLKLLCSRVDLAEEKATIRGLFLESSTILERLLRSSIWAWAALVFGQSRDTELLRVLRESPEGRGQSYDLDKLSFGTIAVLFRRLPEAIAQSSMAPQIARKLGRGQVYDPMAKPGKLNDRLSELISIRNKIEHDKGRFWSDASFGASKVCVSDALTKTIDLVILLFRLGAIPAWAYVTHQIRDVLARTTYKLVLDDGSAAELRITNGLELGGVYLYFSGDVNPRPVDPLIIPSEEQRDVP